MRTDFKPIENIPKSAAKLVSLNFDPIEKLVEQYTVLQKEIEYQEKLRNNEIIEVNAKGAVRTYRAEIHMSLYDKLINISEKLTRYGYGRVPETTIVEDKRIPPLVVQLTQEGDTYNINEVPKVEE